jgi:hypothetical protein
MQCGEKHALIFLSITLYVFGFVSYLQKFSASLAEWQNIKHRRTYIVCGHSTFSLENSCETFPLENLIK